MNTFDLFAPRLDRMFVVIFSAFFIAVAFFSMAGPVEAAAPSSQDVKAAVSAVNGLAADLYRELAEDGQNLCFSPYSISTAFAMTYAGARGETAAEMQRSLRYGAGIHGANRTLMGDLMNIPSNAGELSVANSIWPARGFRVASAFSNVMRRDYFTEVLPQDYRRQPERSRRAINDWVAEKTQEKIKDILGQDSIKADTKMVLVNAIYFKAPWMNEFQEDKTTDAEFFISLMDKKNVRMMNNTDSFQYANFDGVQVLKLPYRQGVFSMLVVLPKEMEGLRAIEDNLSAAEIERYQTKLERRRVNVFIPKFKAEQTFDLIPPLEALGVKSAFLSGAADFSAIGGKRDLFINAAVHKAFVEVDEAGTEAAAATAIAMRLTAAYPRAAEDIVTFRADHPFLYLIQEDHSGAILFMGKVAKP